MPNGAEQISIETTIQPAIRRARMAQCRSHAEHGSSSAPGHTRRRHPLIRRIEIAATAMTASRIYGTAP